jgi:hypothetical protein
MRVRKPEKHFGEQNNHEQVLHDVYKALRGNISYGHRTQDGFAQDNIDGTLVQVQNTGISGTQFSVQHNLNRIPIGYHVINKSQFIDFLPGTTPWTETHIYLIGSTTNARVTFFVF